MKQNLFAHLALARAAQVAHGHESPCFQDKFLHGFNDGMLSSQDTVLCRKDGKSVRRYSATSLIHMTRRYLPEDLRDHQSSMAQ